MLKHSQARVIAAMFAASFGLLDARVSDGYDMLVVGAGIVGTVLADLGARELGLKVLVVDHRSHIGGMCNDQIQGLPAVSSYGPLSIHTRSGGVALLASTRQHNQCSASHGQPIQWRLCAVSYHD